MSAHGDVTGTITLSVDTRSAGYYGETESTVEIQLDEQCGRCSGVGTDCRFCDGVGYHISTHGEQILDFLKRHVHFNVKKRE